jgi:hypothetical protein
MNLFSKIWQLYVDSAEYIVIAAFVFMFIPEALISGLWLWYPAIFLFAMPAVFITIQRNR